MRHYKSEVVSVDVDLSGYNLTELRSKRHGWNNTQIKFLEDWHSLIGPTRVGQYVYKTKFSVYRKAKTLGLTVSDYERGIWTEFEDRELSKRYKIDSIEEIAKDLGRTYFSIVNRKYSLGLTSPDYFWNSDLDKIILEMHGKYPMREIVKEVNKISGVTRTHTAVTHRSQYLGFNNHSKMLSLAYIKHFYDEDYFSIPNLENSYWAGFLAADGCLESRGSVLLTLKSIDIEHLRFFKRCVGYTGNIYTYYNKAGCCISCLNFYHAHKWVNDLRENFNITPRKTYTLKPPAKLDSNCSLAFIVGLIDGDGSIFIDGRKRFVLQMQGTEAIVEWVRSWFNLIVPLENSKKSPKIYHISRTRCCYEYKVGGKRARKICYELLKLSIPRLLRKLSNIYMYDLIKGEHRVW